MLPRTQHRRKRDAFFFTSLNTCSTMLYNCKLLDFELTDHWTQNAGPKPRLYFGKEIVGKKKGCLLPLVSPEIALYSAGGTGLYSPFFEKHHGIHLLMQRISADWRLSKSIPTFSLPYNHFCLHLQSAL